MANGSLYDISLSHKEAEALVNLIMEGLQAFKLLNYSCCYEDYINSIKMVVQLSSSAVTIAQPRISLYTFSCHLDAFNPALRQISELLDYMAIKKNTMKK